MTKKTVVIGRSTSNSDVDFDLSMEGPAFKISRRQVGKCILKHLFRRDVGHMQRLLKIQGPPPLHSYFPLVQDLFRVEYLSEMLKRILALNRLGSSAVYWDIIINSPFCCILGHNY